MENKEAINDLLKGYVKLFQDEKDRLQQIREFLKGANDGEIYGRSNFNGHITLSAFIINKQLDHLLLIKHKTLNRWLQPGGHADAQDPNLIKGALREVKEETGLESEDLELYTLPLTPIFDIDTHLIPANLKKNEPQHHHHDLRYLFICSEEGFKKIKGEAGTEIKWIPIKSLVEDLTFDHIINKIDTLVVKSTSAISNTL